MASVDPCFYFFPALGVAFFGGEGFQFGVESDENRFWKAIGEVKSDVLDRGGAFKMWQVATAMPTGSANLRIGRFLEGLFKHGMGDYKRGTRR